MLHSQPHTLRRRSRRRTRTRNQSPRARIHSLPRPPFRRPRQRTWRDPPPQAPHRAHRRLQLRRRPRQRPHHPQRRAPLRLPLQVLPLVFIPHPLHPSIVLKDMEVAPEAGRAARHTLPRSQAHLCDPAAYKGSHPKIVSEMLGHSSVSITLDTYSHMIPGLGALLRGQWRARYATIQVLAAWVVRIATDLWPVALATALRDPQT